MSPSTDLFRELFLHDIPLIDVRSEGEFADGHFPCSFNLPLMNNQERHLVGIEYKTKGQEAAISLGHQLVNGKIKDERIQKWLSFIEKNPSAKLYCFRGGLRSQIATEWIKASGREIQKLPGGYKALRQFLLDQIAENNKRFIIITGRTGSKKSIVLNQIKHFHPIIDLEKNANHRGSSFGYLGTQPFQITFENSIAVELLKLSTKPFSSIVVEDESQRIGLVQVPNNLFKQIQNGKFICLEIPLEHRIKHIIQEYVYDEEKKQGSKEAVYSKLHLSLIRIQKKLGGLRFKEIQEALEKAFSNDKNHELWVEKLLSYYYDPMYDYRIKQIEKQIIFKGNELEIINFIKEGSYDKENFK